MTDTIKLSTSPWDAAVSRFSDKSVVGSHLRTAEWANEMPLALRDGAFFSAGVSKVRTLEAMRSRMVQALSQERDAMIMERGGERQGRLMNRQRFVAEMRDLLGAPAGDSGRLTDLGSRRRLELIWEFQTADAHGYAAHEAGMDPDVLDAYPAQRLVRIESRRNRRDWYTRWGEAGASVGFAGASTRAMVALKTSPIWTALSRFGRPWPPFDFGSGMGLEDVEREEAEALGLLDPGETPAQRLRSLGDGIADARQRWSDSLEASVRGLGDEAKESLRSAFGDDVSLDGERVQWTGDRLADLWERAIGPGPKTFTDADRHAFGVAPTRAIEVARRDLGISLEGWQLEVRASELRHMAWKHGQPNVVPDSPGERFSDQRPIGVGEVRAIPMAWRSPTRMEWAPGNAPQMADTPADWPHPAFRTILETGRRLYVGEYSADASGKILRVATMWVKKEGGQP